MKIILLTISSELESAKRLGFETHTGVNTSVESYNDSIVIRWGRSQLYCNKKGRSVDFSNVINPSAAINLNCCKDKSIIRIGRVAPTPKIFTKEIPLGVRAVIRYNEHTNGSDFKVKEGPYKLMDQEYAKEFVDTDIEYRVWFVGNKIFGCKRVPLNVSHTKQLPCRSEWGYKYVKVPSILSSYTLAAAKEIGLESGAADVLEKDGKYYFLELNSAPSIDTNKLIKFFRRGLIELVNHKFHLSLPISDSMYRM